MERKNGQRNPLPLVFYWPTLGLSKEWTNDCGICRWAYRKGLKLAKIFIISGPPGIGKSTSGSYFVPENLTIIDPDQIAQRYREQGFQDYKDIGNLNSATLLKEN